MITGGETSAWLMMNSPWIIPSISHWYHYCCCYCCFSRVLCLGVVQGSEGGPPAGQWSMLSDPPKPNMCSGACWTDSITKIKHANAWNLKRASSARVLLFFFAPSGAKLRRPREPISACELVSPQLLRGDFTSILLIIGKRNEDWCMRTRVGYHMTTHRDLRPNLAQATGTTRPSGVSGSWAVTGNPLPKIRTVGQYGTEVAWKFCCGLNSVHSSDNQVEKWGCFLQTSGSKVHITSSNCFDWIPGWMFIVNTGEVNQVSLNMWRNDTTSTHAVKTWMKRADSNSNSGIVELIFSH